ncbi:MAG: alpha/beta hydrolase [Maritimibacter harenae]
MSKIGLAWALARVLMPDALTRAIYAGRLPAVDGRRIDAKAQAVTDLVARLRDPDAIPTLEESRAQLLTMAQRLDQPRPADVTVADITLDGVAGPRRARVYAPPGTDPKTPQATLFYLHGGGWVQGSIETHDGLCGHIAKDAGVRVISYDYVLAPEHVFPAPPDDVLAAYRSLLASDLGVTAERLAVGGDSAGANLTAVLMHDLMAADTPAPAGQVLIYPAVDGGMNSRSHVALAEQPLLPRIRIEWFLDLYLSEGQDMTDPRVSPVRSDRLAGQPPALIVAGGHDPLWDDGRSYAKALETAGVPVTFAPYPGQVHAFLSMAKAIGQGRAARGDVVRWLTALFAKG